MVYGHTRPTAQCFPAIPSQHLEIPDQQGAHLGNPATGFQGKETKRRSISEVTAA